MGTMNGKTVIITGAGRAVLSDGTSCGSIGYGKAGWVRNMLQPTFHS